MIPIARTAPLLLAALLLASACQQGGPAVGVLVSGGVSVAAEAAAAVPGDGQVGLTVVATSPNDAVLALDGAERMVQEGVVAVVGHSNSNASLAASQVYNRAGIVQIAPTTTATAYERAGPYSFRLVPSDREQALLLARAALAAAEGGRVAVAYENDAYGYGLYRDLQHAADSLGLELTDAAAYLVREPVATLGDVLTALLRSRPAVLLWLGRPTPLDTLMPRIRAAGAQVIASDALDTGRVRRNEGGTFTGIWFVELLAPAVHDHAAAVLGERVDVSRVGAEGILTYDAVSVLRAAVAAGARQGSEIRNYLHSLGRTRPAFQGLAGPIQFDEHRTVQRPWRLARVTLAGVADVPEVR